MKLRDSVVLITGAAKRVGRVIALHLAAQGADLIIHYRQSLEEAERLQQHIKKKHRTRVALLAGDLAHVDEVKKLARDSLNIFGRVDVLVNNASTFYPTPLGRVSEDQWADLFDVNARAPFFLSQALGLDMKRRGRGKIVNIADWAALKPYKQFVPYCAAKAALIAMTQGLAKNFAPRVQVNAILPGRVACPEETQTAQKTQNPLKPLGRAQDIANTVQFLIESGDFMTGALLHLDGGRHLE